MLTLSDGRLHMWLCNGCAQSHPTLTAMVWSARWRLSACIGVHGANWSEMSAMVWFHSQRRVHSIQRSLSLVIRSCALCSSFLSSMSSIAYHHSTDHHTSSAHSSAAQSERIALKFGVPGSNLSGAGWRRCHSLSTDSTAPPHQTHGIRRLRWSRFHRSSHTQGYAHSLCHVAQKKSHHSVFISH